MFGKRERVCMCDRQDVLIMTGYPDIIKFVVTRREEEEKGFSIAAENKQVGSLRVQSSQPYSRK
jgi:hypothetical protein